MTDNIVNPNLYKEDIRNTANYTNDRDCESTTKTEIKALLPTLFLMGRNCH